MDMEDDLRKIRLQKTWNPNKLLDDIAAVEVQYGCVLSNAKKSAVIIHAGKTHYALLMAMLGSAKRAAHNMNATAEELVAKMNLQCRIMGLGTGKTGDDDDVVETTPSNFGGTCYHCRKPGHRKADCPLLKNGNSGRNNQN